MNCKINQKEGVFLVDTGSSNSCVDIIKSQKFNLKYSSSFEKALSATAEINQLFISKNNTLTAGSFFFLKNVDLILFELEIVRKKLIEDDGVEIDGIIGSDVLKKGNSIINYQERKILFQL